MHGMYTRMQVDPAQDRQQRSATTICTHICDTAGVASAPSPHREPHHSYSPSLSHERGSKEPHPQESAKDKCACVPPAPLLQAKGMIFRKMMPDTPFLAARFIFRHKNPTIHDIPGPPIQSSATIVAVETTNPERQGKRDSRGLLPKTKQEKPPDPHPKRRLLEIIPLGAVSGTPRKGARHS